MVNEPFLLGAASLLFAGSLEVQPVPVPAIAFRYDANHVMVVLDDLHSHRREELEALYDVDAARDRWDPDRVPGLPVGWLDADVGEWEQMFGSPPLGTEWALELSYAVGVSCSIDRVGVSAVSAPGTFPRGARARASRERRGDRASQR